MNKYFLKQIWVAFKIWIIAVVSNVFLGTLCLTHLFTDADNVNMLVFWGLILGLAVSFPIFLLLILILNRSAANLESGRMIFINFLVAGILFTVMACILFFEFSFFKDSPFWLSLCAMISSIIGVSSQYRYCLKLDKNQYQ